MSLIPPTARVLRVLPKHLLRQQCLAKSQFQFRTLTSKPPSPSTRDAQNPNEPPRIDPVTLHRLEAERRHYYKRRSMYASLGILFGVIATYLTASAIDLENLPNQPPKPTKADSGRRPDDPLVVLGKERKVIVQKLGEEPEEIPDVVETGTSTVPTFPRVLSFFDDENESKSNGTGPTQADDRLVEYQLLGLGIRTVSFLGIQVYVVGMYIATDDIAAFQQQLIRRIDPVASTLVAGEKEKLKAQLFDPEKSEDVWSAVLKESGARTLIRITPTRNTDFHHLRDAWVRTVTARAQSPRYKEEYNDEVFGASMQKFKQLFSSGSIPKTKELLLSRDKKGKLAVWYDDGKNGGQRLGQIEDERISRAVWLNYLAGKTVASEGARKSIVDGVMEFVERPVGTVATQVHV